MPLSDMAIRKAKTREKAYKLYDELGLYVIVSPSGSRLWRMKFKHRGVEKKPSFGFYPEVTRERRRRVPRCGGRAGRPAVGAATIKKQ